MYNRQRSRLSNLREILEYFNQKNASPPVVSEPVVFRPTHTTDQTMRRFNQPQPNNADLQLHSFAGTLHRVTFDFLDNQSNSNQKKLPIHCRSGPGKKTAVMAPAAGLHDPASGLDPSAGDGEEGAQSRESRSAQKNPKATAYLPGDRVIFAESPTAPGIPVVYRTPEERAANPDRLNLDRRKLTVCPILEGEDQLRLLNYQHNTITRIQHLTSLRRLIFLDLYDNQIEQVDGLSFLRSLRVLMLGKNRIKKIENLDALVKLDVLDLHGNQISSIENLKHLTELRVLNLAGNHITTVDNLTGIDALAELNLRRNKIRTVSDIDTLPNLQRLFLSFNEISSFEDVQCLGDSSSLSEICLDGNPLAQDPAYKQVVLRNMQQLKQLDMRRVTEEERRLALVMARKEEEKRRELNKVAILKERRRLAINNAKRQWETMQGSLMSRTGKMVRAPELYSGARMGSLSPAAPGGDPFSAPFPHDDDTELVSVTSDRRASRPGSAHSNLTDMSQDSVRDPDPSRLAHRRSESKSATKETILFGGDTVENMHMVAELEEDTLNIYGPLALAAFDRAWGLQAASAVTTIVFKFVDFDEICKHIHKVRTRFPNTQNLIFGNTNVHSLQQISALSVVRSLEQLTIELDGNPVTKFTLWRLFTLHRLSHFNLKKINGVEVSTADIINAERLFGPVTQVVMSQLTQLRLHTTVPDMGRKHGAPQGEEGKPRKGDRGDKAHQEQPGKAALTYLAPDMRGRKQEVASKREFSRAYLSEVTKEAVCTDRKHSQLVRVWPAMFLSLVQTAVTQLMDTKNFAKNSLDTIERS
ncbi:leucine-rich repeat-containing protein 49-like isoform X2 [Babylonia areolata]|uniref:leucine-rich repeat-containing protein 49-like isoform X2 n=1 Tax=Babylonia areolata TaxID=304850 RepID=UPI003FD3E10C